MRRVDLYLRTIQEMKTDEIKIMVILYEIIMVSHKISLRAHHYLDKNTTTNLLYHFSSQQYVW